jgi:hypothetical protein
MGIRNKFEQSIWWNPKCAFKFNDLEDDFWAGYETKKIAFVNEIAAEKIGGNQASKDAERLNTLMKIIHERGMNLEEIGKPLGLTGARICQRIGQSKLKQASPPS